MEKFLLATTAIVAFSTAAYAEVTISGNAELGVAYADNEDDVDLEDGEVGVDDNALFHTDIDVTFTMTGGTDSGLAFGASVDLSDAIGDGDGAEGTDDDNDDGGVNMFISGGFGVLTMGDTNGALDQATTEVGFNATSIRDAHEHAGWNGVNGLDGTFDGQIMRYDYTIGDYTFSASAELDDADIDNSDPVFGVGFSGSIDFAGTALNFGLGYQTSQNEIGDDDDVGTDLDAYAVSLGATFGAITTGIAYQNIDGDGTASDNEYIGVGIGYSANALSLHANYGHEDIEGDNDEGFGITAGYELGEGIQLQAGYGFGETGGDDVAAFDFGVRMSF